MAGAAARRPAGCPATTQPTSARPRRPHWVRAGGGTPDRDQMREKSQKMMADRDEKLKKIFNEDQYKKWKDEIEPSMRPQRQGGGGNN